MKAMLRYTNGSDSVSGEAPVAPPYIFKMKRTFVYTDISFIWHRASLK